MPYCASLIKSNFPPFHISTGPAQPASNQDGANVSGSKNGGHFAWPPNVAACMCVPMCVCMAN